MKKTLIALAVAAAVPTLAQAQTSIQLTGSVDVAVESLNKDANSSNKGDIKITDGVWGGSRVGIVGSEDLGSGLKAIFSLEYRVHADTGRLADADRFWQGQSWVGLDGSFGTVKLGRQDTPMADVIKLGDMTDQSWYFSSNGLAGIIDKTDNLIVYSTPSLGGFRLQAAYGSGEATPDTVTNDAAAGTSDNLNKLNDMYTIGGVGEWGGVSVGIGYQSFDGGKINNIKRRNELAASLGLSLGRFGAGLGYGRSELKAETGLGKKAKAFYGSLSYQVTDSGTAYLNYQRTDLEGYSDIKNENGIGLAYTHGLSKRTFVYGAVGVGKAEIPGQDDLKLHGFALGIRHFF